MTTRLYARCRLAEWGVWNRDRPRGYARTGTDGLAPMAREVNEPFPLRLAIVDLIVTQMRPRHRDVLLTTYSQGGTRRAKAMRLGLTYGTYCGLLKSAELLVASQLGYAEHLL